MARNPCRFEGQNSPAPYTDSSYDEILFCVFISFTYQVLLICQIWRSVRMIVDTGLHYTGMKRDEAIKMFVDHAWDDSDFTRKEVQLIYWQG